MLKESLCKVIICRHEPGYFFRDLLRKLERKPWERERRIGCMRSTLWRTTAKRQVFRAGWNLWEGQAKDAPFEAVEELQQVLGMTPAVYRWVAPALTVYSGRRGIDPRVAPREALLALQGIGPEEVESFLATRAEGTPENLLGAEGHETTSRERIEAENLALRHQLNVVCRSARKRVRLCRSGRLLFSWLYRLWPGVLDSVVIIQPETVVR